MIKKISYLIMITILFFGFYLPVNALNVVDLSHKGSISITLKDKDNNKIKNAEITLYHIADAINENNNLKFSLREDLNCNTSLDNIKEISKCINENTTKYTLVTNENGVVKFDNLTLGVYLVSQTKSVEGYSNIDSFLVDIPRVENNSWTYDIVSEPKTDIYKVMDVIVEKKWNTESNNIPNSVTIELYNHDVLVDSIVLNEENNWTHTFSNIEKSDKYNVREINVPKGYTPSYKQNDNVFTVTNTDTLAYTGQVFYPILIMTFTGIMFILFGIKIMKTEE